MGLCRAASSAFASCCCCLGVGPRLAGCPQRRLLWPRRVLLWGEHHRGARRSLVPRRTIRRNLYRPCARSFPLPLTTSWSYSRKICPTFVTSWNLSNQATTFSAKPLTSLGTPVELAQVCLVRIDMNEETPVAGGARTRYPPRALYPSRTAWRFAAQSRFAASACFSSQMSATLRRRPISIACQSAGWW